jgi:hypothetical protein
MESKAMHEVALPQDTDAKPAPLAMGRGLEKCSGPAWAIVVVGAVVGGDVVAVVAVVAVDFVVAAAPQPATARPTSSSNGNQDAGRNSHHLTGRCSGLGTGPL